jgi:hypothetical protein
MCGHRDPQRTTWQAPDLQPAAVHNGLPRRLQSKKKKENVQGLWDFLLRTPISTQTSTVVSGSWTVALPRKGGGKTWMHSLEENGHPSKLPKYLSFFCERNLMPPADSECWGKGASLEDVALSENSWPVDGTVRLSLGGSSVAPSEKHSCAALIL